MGELQKIQAIQIIARNGMLMAFHHHEKKGRNGQDDIDFLQQILFTPDRSTRFTLILNF